jgi:hypothetical protein
MKQMIKMFLPAVLFCGIAFTGWGQSMVPIIQQTQSVIGQIEKGGDVVDVALYDYIFKDNNSVFTYEYQFYASDSYSIRVIGDDARNTNLAVRIYRYVGSNWQQVKQTQATGRSTALLPFKPAATERYRIEISCDLTGGYASSCFGLLIVRVE